MITDFTFAVTPQLYFGCGKISEAPGLVKKFGSRILLVTGAKSFVASSHCLSLLERLQSQALQVEQYAIENEPTPLMIDQAVARYSSYSPDVVVAVGGGSVLDAGKAISAMLPLNESVKDYLEGVGTKRHPGVKIPFVAIPTTSGTGSEATKNAVLSETGESGFKKSLRHDKFVPDAAIVDPVLTLTCSPSTTAASGMDAFTQLLESYLSTKANPLTDALACEGLRQVSRWLKRAYNDGSDLEARTGMSLAAYLSGITLANAGLGLVHGFASSVGGFFEIPHGVICSALMAPANSITVARLRNKKKNEPALAKYSTIGKLFSFEQNRSDEYYIDQLLTVIEQMTTDFRIPRFSDYGIRTPDFEKIVNATDNKNNPVEINKEGMIEILEMAL